MNSGAADPKSSPQGTGAPQQGRNLGPSHYLFAAVLLLRLFVLTRLTLSPSLLPAGGDMHFYNEWAKRIAVGQLTDHLAFYGLPLYAYFLAGVYKLFGPNPFVPGLLQAFAEAGTAVLIYKIALRVFSDHARAIGIVSAVGWAIFVPAQAYAAILMPTSWLVLVFWVVVWQIVKQDTAPSPTLSLKLGLLIGVTAMGVATILFLAPLVIAALWLRSRIENFRRNALAGTALLLLGVIFGTSPCWLHNNLVARDPVFLSAHSGINFWIGNNPTANGYPHFPPGLRAGQAAMLEDSIAGAESAAGRSLKRSQVSAYWSAKAGDYIRDNFGGWLRLLFVKFRNFWSAFQYDDLSIITYLREQRVILPGIYFGVAAAFGIPGMLLAWKTEWRSRWITGAILLHMAALLSVFTTERYRLAVVPGLLLLGVWSLSVLWENIARPQYRQIALYLAILFSSTIFVSWPQREKSLWALDAYNSGWQALEAKNLELAEKKLAVAHAYVPANAETLFALGNLRLAQGGLNAAEALYRETLSYDREHQGALNNLGVVMLGQNKLGDAEMLFRLVLSRDPRNAKSHYLLAKTFLAKGDIASARLEIDHALGLKPNQAEFVALKSEIEKAARP